MLSIDLYDIDIHICKRKNKREDLEIDVDLGDFDCCIAIHGCHWCVFQSPKRQQSEQTRPCAPKRGSHDQYFVLFFIHFVLQLETRYLFQTLHLTNKSSTKHLNFMAWLVWALQQTMFKLFFFILSATCIEYVVDKEDPVSVKDYCTAQKIRINFN